MNTLQELENLFRSNGYSISIGRKRSTGTPLIRQVLAGDRRITVGGMRWVSQETSGGVV